MKKVLSFIMIMLFGAIFLIVPINANDYSDDYYEGFEDGFNAGLNEVFNENNLMPLAIPRGKGTIGPAPEFIGFNIPINKKVKNITLINLYGYSFKDLSYMVSGVKQGLGIYYENSYQLITFNSQYNEFNEIMEFALDKDEIVVSIDIILALSNPQLPDAKVQIILNNISNKVGFYINNKILNDAAIDRFKEILLIELREELDDSYSMAMYDIFHYGFSNEYDTTQSKPYKDGFNAGVATNSDFSFTGLLAQIFTGLGSFLAIELLPNITIGAIIAVPIVFGIIAFIIGKRGGKSD